MDAANAIAEFLTSRRAKITPEQAGLPSYGSAGCPGCAVRRFRKLIGHGITRSPPPW